MQNVNQKLVSDFIEQIWNTQEFQKLDNFLHLEFTDYSLPAALPSNQEGLKTWILATSAAFEHQTIIEDQVTEGDKSVVKIRMQLKHIGAWREIEPTGLEVHTKGYRLFKIQEGKIVAHWGLIDGQAIENQLKEAAHGCKLLH